MFFFIILKDCSNDKCMKCPGGADFNVENKCPDVFQCTDSAKSCSSNGICTDAACVCNDNFAGNDCSVIKSKYSGSFRSQCSSILKKA